MKKIIFPLAVLMCVFVLAACGGVSEDEFVATLNCSEGMSEYAVEGTPIQFCYDPAWGEPSVHDYGDTGGVIGSIRYVTFDSSPGGPEIWYQSADYSINGFKPFSFDDLNVYTDDEGVWADVKEQFEEGYNFSDDDLDVRKADIGGVRAVRVHIKRTAKIVGGTEDVVTYYVPNAWEGYHVTVTATYSMAEELDDFVYDMIL